MKTDTDAIAKQAETILAELAAELVAQTDATDYASVRLDVNVNGKITWTCYTPDVGHTDGATFAESLAGQHDNPTRADVFRAQAAALLAKADALSK